MHSNLILFLSNTAIMMSSIFIPAYADELGINKFGIGLIGAAYGLSIFFSSYIFSRASDIRGRRIFIKFGLLSSAIVFALQSFARNVVSLIAVRAIAGFSIGVFTAPLIAYTFESGGMLGIFSSYGSLGWAFGSILAGIIGHQGESYKYLHEFLPYWEVFFLSSIFFFVSFYISLKLTKAEKKIVHVSMFPRELIRRNLGIYMPSFLRHFGAHSIWVIFPIFLTSLGATKFWVGMLYFINAGMQFFVMRRLDAKNEIKLINLGLALSSAVFFSYAFAKNFYQVIPIQVLLAVSYSSLYVGDLVYLTKRNEEKATAVGILNSFTSVSMAVGPFFGGAISQFYGFDAVMYSASVLAMLGLVVSLGSTERDSCSLLPAA